MAYTTTLAQRRADIKYRASHQDQIKALRRNYYAANRERLKAGQKERYAKKRKAQKLAKLKLALSAIANPGRNKADPE
jgi:hypothetical protein